MTTYVQTVIDALEEELPNQSETIIGLYALLAMSKGTGTTMEDVHDAWAVWRAYTRPDHPDLIPFDQLTDEVKAYDEKYLIAIQRVSINLGLDKPV